MDNEFHGKSAWRHKRQDVQALRALAVVAVVAYHANLPLRGGYLGVDIFFVISGYVIASVLLREFDATGTINLKNFYLRRIRRLLPALLILVTTFFLVSLAIFPVFFPLETSILTGVAGIFSLANVVIDRTTFDYFAPPAKENIFLHLWSLSVEEQFYLIFPFLLLALLARSGFGKRTKSIVLGLTFFSFCLAIFGSSELRALLPFGQSAVGFYSPVSRAWEFGVGAAVATFRINAQSIGKRRILFAIGTVLVSSSLLLLSDGFRTPGLTTAIPVLGTALIIISKSHLLRRAPRWVLFIGEISYSWYLWHWPMIVLGQIVWPSQAWIPGIVALISVAPATASYLFVERPWRYDYESKKYLRPRLIVAMTLFPLVLAASTPNIYLSLIEPISNRSQLSGDFEQDEYYEALDSLSYNCPNISDCVSSKRDRPPTVVILGDSHGAHLFVGLAELLPEENVAWLRSSASTYQSLESDSGRLDSVFQSSTTHTIVVGEYWLNPSRDSMPEALRLLAQQTRDAGVSLVIPNGTPHLNFPVFRCKWGLAINVENKVCQFPSEPVMKSAESYLHELEQIELDFGHVLIAPTLQVFCGESVCIVGNEREIFFRDNNHLGVFGSRVAAVPIIDAISSLQRNS